jgi:hypothetical protein
MVRAPCVRLAWLFSTVRRKDGEDTESKLKYLLGMANCMLFLKNQTICRSKRAVPYYLNSRSLVTHAVVKLNKCFSVLAQAK